MFKWMLIAIYLYTSFLCCVISSPLPRPPPRRPSVRSIRPIYSNKVAKEEKETPNWCSIISIQIILKTDWFILLCFRHIKKIFFYSIFKSMWLCNLLSSSLSSSNFFNYCFLLLFPYFSAFLAPPSLICTQNIKNTRLLKPNIEAMND